MFRYFYLSSVMLMLSFPLAVMGQKKDSAKQTADTVKYKYRPTGIRFGGDLLSTIKSNYVKSFTGWEVNADVDFYRYYLAVDYGSWGRNYHTDSLNYTNDGRYFRIGGDINFLTKDPDKNMFFIGLRYGHASFSEHFDIIVHDPLWISQTAGNRNSYDNVNSKAHWLEITTGLRVKMYKIFWMGYTARLKFALKTSNTDQMLPHDVPGFGSTAKPITYGFNYQLFIRIPLPKKK